REGRAIGREAAEGQVASRAGRGQTSAKGPDILVGGSVIQDVIAEALVAALIDRGQHTAGTSIECSGGHIARKICQRPVQDGGVQARLRLFSPQPRPSAAWSQRAQRRGGRARGASSLGGRVNHPRPRAAPPDQSRGGYTDYQVARDRRGPRESTCGTAYSSAANM